MKLIENIFRVKTGSKLFILIAGLAGVVLLIISYACDFEKTEHNEVHYSDELTEYGNNLENKLERTLSSVTGENSVEVMITFSSTFETVYSDNADKNSFGISESKNDAQNSVVKRKCPKVNGVMIVCKTLFDSESVIAIKKAAATALNVSESKIYIIGGEEINEKSS